MSVGLGNIWRFPFTAYENGGGAFLIPYIIVLVLIGKPIYYMELAIGQFTSQGSVKAIQAIPIMKGTIIGYLVDFYNPFIYSFRNWYWTTNWNNLRRQLLLLIDCVNTLLHVQIFCYWITMGKMLVKLGTKLHWCTI